MLESLVQGVQARLDEGAQWLGLETEHGEEESSWVQDMLRKVRTGGTAQTQGSRNKTRRGHKINSVGPLSRNRKKILPSPLHVSSFFF